MTRWTAEQANAWYAAQPWPVGCNFIPSNAINQLEMWQAETFDPATIDRELVGLRNSASTPCASICVTTALCRRRRRLPGPSTASSTWRAHTASARLSSSSTTVGTPDAARSQPPPSPASQLGAGAEPRRAHRQRPRTQWTGLGDVRAGRDQGPLLRTSAFSFGMLVQRARATTNGARSLPLLKQTFAWARGLAQPAAPVLRHLGSTTRDNAFPTGGFRASSLSTTTTTLRTCSARSTHCVRMAAADLHRVAAPGAQRGGGVPAGLPQERVGCINWGLVSGKTQTIFAWDTPTDGTEPALWFHDLLRQDGTPFNPAGSRPSSATRQATP